jgi:thymidylate synthase (FAD)
MKTVKPKVFLVGETKVIEHGLHDYLHHVGASGWSTTDDEERSEFENEPVGMQQVSDSERLTEVMGRMCYKSFAPGLNPNVKKVREGNDTYMANLIKTGHGSVMEHAVLNFIFVDVSRVFTHELVRHRAGVAISQESLRYVRLTNLRANIPPCIAENNEATAFFKECFHTMEDWQEQLADMYNIDSPDMPFSRKKELTSAFRRVAPIGLGTAIGWSCNFRTLRHVLEMRTDPPAEEEIRDVFSQVYDIVDKRYPNFFQDYTPQEVNGHTHVGAKPKI